MPPPPPEDLPELRPGDILTAAWLNRLRRIVLGSRVQLGSGLAGVTGPSGTTIAAVGRATEGLIPARAPAAGIPAGGSATVTIRVRSGNALVNGTQTVTAINDSDTSAVTAKVGGAKIWIYPYAGAYWVVQEMC